MNELTVQEKTNNLLLSFLSVISVTWLSWFVLDNSSQEENPMVWGILKPMNYILNNTISIGLFIIVTTLILYIIMNYETKRL